MNPQLSNLYTSPHPDKAYKYYTILLASDRHSDRETAFWLELAIPKPPERIDLAAVIDILRKMEVILYDLLMQATPNLQTDLNNWLNYIANIPHMLESGTGIDAKRLISQALDSSKTSTIEILKNDPTIGRKLRILQQETQYLYHQILRIPLKLVIPEGQQDLVLRLQQQLLELLQVGLKQVENTPNYQYSIQKLERIQTYLMNPNIPYKVVKSDIRQAINYLQQSYNSNELQNKQLQLEKIIHALDEFSKSL